MQGIVSHLQISSVHLPSSSLGWGTTKGEQREQNVDVDLGLLGPNPAGVKKIDMGT